MWAYVSYIPIHFTLRLRARRACSLGLRARKDKIELGVTPRVGICLLYPLYISRSACARAEPMVSACVLEKSLKMYRGYRRHMPTRGCFLG